MTAQEMWQTSGLAGDYEAWAFGDDPDALAELVRTGIKTATASAYPLYELEGEELPKVGEYSVILDTRDEAVCIIRTSRVYVTPYRDITPEQAYREGEGDRSLDYWRKVHETFFRREMEDAGLTFTEEMGVVCEEFEVVYPREV